MGEVAVSPHTEPSEALYKKLRPGPGRSAAEVAEHQRMRIEGAMLQIVAERGYPAVTVRELAQVASVSSRAFYQHYSGKEECFLRTHEMIVRRIARRVAAAQVGKADWHESLHLTIATYLAELQSDPRAAKLVLVDAYVAGSVALDQVRGAEQMFATRIVECFEMTASQLTFPSQLARGIVAGMMCVARSQLAMDREPQFTYLAGRLGSWAAAIFKAFGTGAGQGSPLIFKRSAPEAVVTAPADGRSRSLASDKRGLIVAALAKLAAVEGYEELTVRKIRVSAGASQKKFKMYFGGVADCFLEAVDFYASNITSHLEADQSVDRSLNWVFEDPVELLCKCVAEDSTLASLCFVDVLSPGAEGVSGLDRFIREIGELFAKRGIEDAGTTPFPEASAAAIWGAMREEILCKRRSQLPEIVPLLRIFAAAPVRVSEGATFDDHWASHAIP